MTYQTTTIEDSIHQIAIDNRRLTRRLEELKNDIKKSQVNALQGVLDALLKCVTK